METGQYGNGGEEEDELRARVPGIDVRIPPALHARGRKPATRLRH